MHRPWSRTTAFSGLLAVVFLAFAVSAGQSSAPQSLSILYPKHNAAVGRRVNLVLDPATNWSAVPFFQVVVGKTEFPVVDTSSGRHAFQGIALEPGLNTLTVRVLAPALSSEKKPSKKEEERKFAVVQSRSISVFNQEGSLSGVPALHQPSFFHTRAGEAECSGCHRLESGPLDLKHEKPQDVLCFACHRDIPTGQNIHGPAAVWNCLSCHDPDRSPVRYQFAPTDLWKVTRTVLPAEPAVFIFSADALFLTEKAAFRNETGRADFSGDREKRRNLFQEVLEYAKQNPLDRVRIEVHGHGVPSGGPVQDRAKAEKAVQQLTEARAQAVAGVLREYGLAEKGRITAVGMGNALPRATGEGAEARALNERIEIIISPEVITSRNSIALPVLPGRERVVLDIHYSRGPVVRDLRITERLPKGVQYMKGSAVTGGRAKEPLVKDGELSWQVGDRGASVQESLTYLVKKDKDATAAGAILSLQFTIGTKAEKRVYDPAHPGRQDQDVQEVCARCHQGMLAGSFRHGPADAGYCTLCHDPHASDNPGWTRDQDWRLCTSCHSEKKKDVHMIAGFVRGISHPTKKVADPSRPGRNISCISCHSPHSSHVKELLSFEVRSKFEICRYCHPGK